MKNPRYIAIAIEFVIILLASFGGLLLNIAPPEETGAKYAIVIVSSLSLIVFLFIVAQKQRTAKYLKKWLIAAWIFLAMFITSAFFYRYHFNQLTFLYPSKPDEGEQKRYVKGLVLTKEADTEVKNNPKLATNPAELLDKFGEYSRNEVWTQDSLDQASTTLLIYYTLVVMNLVLTCFCLIEALLLRYSQPNVAPDLRSDSPMQVDIASEKKVMKIKVLFMAANPVDAVPLRLDQEIRGIMEKIRAAAHRDLIEVVSIWAVRPDDLLQSLNEHKPHIVHFSGHGSKSAAIILNDKDGNPKPVERAALVRLFQTLKDNVQVVVLNACYSQSQAEGITEHICCAIGMNNAIEDDAAITFAASFYRAIAFGRSIKDAFDQGITALTLEGIPQENIPQLLTQKGCDASKVVLIAPD